MTALPMYDLDEEPKCHAYFAQDPIHICDLPPDHDGIHYCECSARVRWSDNDCGDRE